MMLMVDANHAYSVPTAVDLAKEMEKYKVSWFEKPVVPENIEGYRRVQSKTIIPIAVCGTQWPLLGYCPTRYCCFRWFE